MSSSLPKELGFNNDKEVNIPLLGLCFAEKIVSQNRRPRKFSSLSLSLSPKLPQLQTSAEEIHSGTNSFLTRLISLNKKSFLKGGE